MKLQTYKNLYSYSITKELSRGNEVNITYFKNTGIYKIVKMVKFEVIEEYDTYNQYRAKIVFRSLLNA